MERHDAASPATRLAGGRGELRVGYQVAATLGPWEVALCDGPGPRVFTCRTRVTDEHGLWMSQGGFDLALRLGQAELVWRSVQPSRDGEALTVELRGRPTVTEYAALTGQ